MAYGFRRPFESLCSCWVMQNMVGWAVRIGSVELRIGSGALIISNSVNNAINYIGPVALKILFNSVILGSTVRAATAL